MPSTWSVSLDMLLKTNNIFYQDITIDDDVIIQSLHENGSII
ncbi:8988_t:CDS:2 [Dentiscutata erythropus]|uniref:8988_t:CDS:1 n=1 Tax=Dentiscutata erythropus TaxID=1348616 RepID=A0A9N8W9Q1_9GLOM|nr:8988_t:CDS:2 [Dentiscutata erythropus]